MTPVMSKLVERQKEVKGVSNNLHNAQLALCKIQHLIGIEKIDSMLEEIKPIYRKNQVELDAINKKIDKIQKECQHGQWIWLGRDSHYDHEECGICGYVDYKA